MELTNQVAVLQDEVKLLKGEIKSILKEIRTAVLLRDNPFAAGLDALATSPATAAAAREPEPARPAPEPEPAPHATAPQNAPQPAPEVQQVAPAQPEQQVVPPPAPAQPVLAEQPIVQSQAPSPPPAWAGPLPAPQPAPAPFTPSPALAGQLAQQQVALDPQYAEAINLPIPISRARGQTEPMSADEQTSSTIDDTSPERQSWSLPAIAGLAVWAEEAITTLGPRRYHFVLELSSFADLLSDDARDVLASLVDAEALDNDQRPVNVNECLVVLRQLEAIVHGEKVVKLPRRGGPRHRRIR